MFASSPLREQKSFLYPPLKCLAFSYITLPSTLSLHHILMCLIKHQAWREGHAADDVLFFPRQNRHQLKHEDKELSLPCLSIRVCPTTRCIKKPCGFFSKPATLVGLLHLRSFVPPPNLPPILPTQQPPPLSPLLSVCNGPDVKGGRKKKH